MRNLEISPAVQLLDMIIENPQDFNDLEYDFSTDKIRYTSVAGVVEIYYEAKLSNSSAISDDHLVNVSTFVDIDGKNSSKWTDSGKQWIEVVRGSWYVAKGKASEAEFDRRDAEREAHKTKLDLLF